MCCIGRSLPDTGDFDLFTPEPLGTAYLTGADDFDDFILHSETETEDECS